MCVVHDVCFCIAQDEPLQGFVSLDPLRYWGSTRTTRKRHVFFFVFSSLRIYLYSLNILRLGSTKAAFSNHHLRSLRASFCSWSPRLNRRLRRSSRSRSRRALGAAGTGNFGGCLTKQAVFAEVFWAGSNSPTELNSHSETPELQKKPLQHFGGSMSAASSPQIRAQAGPQAPGRRRRKNFGQRLGGMGELGEIGIGEIRASHQCRTVNNALLVGFTTKPKERQTHIWIF